MPKGRNYASNSFGLSWSGNLVVKPKVLMGCVYFIGEPTGRLVKIGMTREAASKRLAAIQPNSPVRLKLLGIIPTRYPLQAERMIHKKFSDAWVSFEWYEITEELDRFMKTNMMDKWFQYDERTTDWLA